MNISAIILAAGSSRRMGEPKALLSIGKKTFLQHIIDTVESAGLANTVVVLGSEAKTIGDSLSSFRGSIIVNSAWEKGQLSSLIAGVNVLDPADCDGILIFPVDHPLFSTDLITRMIESFQIEKSNIVIPTFNGRRGHPILISSDLFGKISEASLDIGLREVVHAHVNDICEMQTEEEGILLNIDTPDDYQRYIHNR